MNADWKVGKAGYVQCANINVARLQFDSLCPYSQKTEEQ